MCGHACVKRGDEGPRDDVKEEIGMTGGRDGTEIEGYRRVWM